VVAAFATRLFSAMVIVRDGGKDYTLGWMFIAVCAVTGVVAANINVTKLRCLTPGLPGE